MKRFFIYSLVLLFIACEEKQLSHTETAKIVAESFYQGDKSTLKQHTTAESYAILANLQPLFAEDENSDPDFKIIDETVDGDVAWVKYSTSYDEKPGVFKLVKQNGQWKVTERRPREKVPF